MTLNKADSALIQKAVSVGTSDLAFPLDENARRYLAWRVVFDLKQGEAFRECPDTILPFFHAEVLESLPEMPGAFNQLIERLAGIDQDAISYFYCLASLFKARVKYSQILKQQPLPTMDQVGPRGLRA